MGLAESLGGHRALSTMIDRIDMAVSFRKVKPPASVVDIVGRMRLSASEKQGAKVYSMALWNHSFGHYRQTNLSQGVSSNNQDFHVHADFRLPRHNIHQRANITCSTPCP